MAFRLLVGVLRAANVGAYSSIDAKNARFSSAPKLRAAALAFLANDAAIAKEIARQILAVDSEEVDSELALLTPESVPDLVSGQAIT